MTKEEAATALDGSEYGEEGSKELFAQMKDAGLVAVFGASDDLMEFRGAIHDEAGCYGGGSEYLNSSGLLINDCDSDRCPAFEREMSRATPIEANWDDGHGFAWTYTTEIPHAKFTVKEGDELFCEGIVFALSDVPA